MMGVKKPARGGLLGCGGGWLASDSAYCLHEPLRKRLSALGEHLTPLAWEECRLQKEGIFFVFGE